MSPFQGGTTPGRHGVSCGWATGCPTSRASSSLLTSPGATHFALNFSPSCLSPVRSARVHSWFAPSRSRSNPTLRSPHESHRDRNRRFPLLSPRSSTSNNKKEGTMCLVKVKQEEDHIVPYRVVNRNRSPPRRRASHRHSRDVEHRYSRTEIVHEASPRPSQSYVSSPPYISAPSYVPVPTPKPLMIPAPQPAPVFVQPPPMPMPVPAPHPPPSHISSHHTQSHHGGAHYVEVSPRSSISSRSSSPPRSEYVYREREIRRERVSEPENPRYEH